MISVNGVKLTDKEIEDIKRQVLVDCLARPGWQVVEATIENTLIWLLKAYSVKKIDNGAFQVENSNG